MALTSRRLFIAVLVGAALVAAGCGSNNSSDTSNASSSSSQPAADTSNALTISTAKTDAGTVLVGAGGRTVYMFKADKNGKSSCDGACAAAWPPVVSGSTPKVSGDADKSKLGSTKRSDGLKQVTYAGWPLYYYVKDTKAGQANGNEVEAFGAEWYALTAAGEEAEGGGGSNASSSSSGY